jgi:hypothetical protein
MQFSNETVNVLKNFSQINPSIAIKPGNKLSTMSPGKSIMANAVVQDVFPSNGAIYDLGRFLGVVSLFEKPTYSFNETHVDIRDNQKSVAYTFCSEDMVIKPSKDDIMVSPDVNINITNDNIQQVLRAATIMSLPNVCISGTDVIQLKAVNSEGTSTDEYAQVIGSNDTGHKFNFIFKSENLKLLPDDYNVIIDSRGISQFRSAKATPKLTYWIAVEQNSEFE